MKQSGSTLRDNAFDKVFYFFNYIFLFACMLIVALPLLNVIAQSLSSPGAVISGKVKFWPLQFTARAYKEVLSSQYLVGGYKNSIIYTIIGTTINLVMTVMAAYPLSRPDFVGRKLITKLFIFTMIFVAPLIPMYLNVRRLGMLDTLWAITIPGAINVYNMIIARTFFQTTIPGEMIEAAELDGASDLQILFLLVLPLSKAVLAVLVLFYAVGHWNAYFDAMIYFSTQSKFPLQLALRDILSSAEAIENMSNITIEQSMRLATVEVMKYAIIVFGSLPVICLYPFIQKYFVKGVMIGSLKG
jgi:ABC-type glycerol-3-phosphate transport system permease component